MKKAWLLLLFLWATDPGAFAESSPGPPNQPERKGRWTYQGELFGSIGWGRFYHGDDLLGSGLEFGGGIGFRPFRGVLRGLGFEVHVKQLQHEIQQSPNHSTDGKALTLLGQVLYHFSDSTVQPYVIGGIGLLKANYTQTGYSEWYDLPGWDYHEEHWTETVDASKMAITFGAGIKAAVNPKLSLRPEISLIDTTPGSGYNWGSFRVSLGVGYHW